MSILTTDDLRPGQVLPFPAWMPPEQEGIRTEFVPWKATGEVPVDWFRRCVFDYEASPEAIITRSCPYSPGDGPCADGLYFLVEEDAVVYVGVSRFISNRLEQHASRKPFTHFAWIGGIPQIFVEYVEATYIAALRPRLNVKLVETLVHGPLLDAYREAHTVPWLPE